VADHPPEPDSPKPDPPMPDPPMPDPHELRRTPLHALHQELGAKLVPFAGYEMPVQYPAGILAEHRHCREAAGLFDVSHMGQATLTGAGAAAAFETLVPGDIAGLPVGRTRYTLFTDDEGGILDDLMVTNAGDHLFLVVNAACKVDDLAHLRSRIGGRVEIRERCRDLRLRPSWHVWHRRQWR